LPCVPDYRGTTYSGSQLSFVRVVRGYIFPLRPLRKKVPGPGKIIYTLDT
jgi:hypothetical protein